MAELTSTAETTANSCCAPAAQATCCESSTKAECCDPSHGEGCGCAADTAGRQPATYASRCASAMPQPPPGHEHRSRRRLLRSERDIDGGSEVFGAALYALGDHEQYPIPPSSPPSAAASPPPSPNCTRARQSSTSALARNRRAALGEARRPDRQSPRPRHDRRDAGPRPRERRQGWRRECRVPQGLHRGHTAPRRKR